MADVPPPSSADIEVARVRARRRLVGMMVLVVAGVIGLPWLFETQPRPLSTDVQVVSAVPSHPGAGGGNTGNAPSIVAVRVPVQPVVEEAEAPVASVASSVTPSARTLASESAASKPQASKPAASKPAAPARIGTAQAPSPASKPSVREAAKPVVVAAQASASKDKDAARAKALLEGKPQAKPASTPAVAQAAKPASKPASDADTRYVVQIGAYSEVPAAHEVRMKAERLGIKTYTQVVVTPAGKKIRVRLGPYATKAEADKAMDALRKAGLSGAVLTL
jgi:DedD protein